MDIACYTHALRLLPSLEPIWVDCSPPVKKNRIVKKKDISGGYPPEMSFFTRGPGRSPGDRKYYISICRNDREKHSHASSFLHTVKHSKSWGIAGVSAHCSLWYSSVDVKRMHPSCSTGPVMLYCMIYLAFGLVVKWSPKKLPRASIQEKIDNFRKSCGIAVFLLLFHLLSIILCE